MCLVDSSVHFRLLLVGGVCCKLLLSRASVGLYIFVVNWILWSTDWSGTCRRNALQPILSRCTDWHGSGVVRRSGWIWGWYVLLILLSSFFPVMAYFIVSISPSSLVGQQKDVKLQVFVTWKGDLFLVLFLGCDTDLQFSTLPVIGCVIILWLVNNYYPFRSLSTVFSCDCRPVRAPGQ